MMRALVALSLMALASCGGGGSHGGPATFSLRGDVQKGPFAVGSEITVNVLDTTLGPTGTVCNTQTSDSLGDFVVSSMIGTPEVEIVAQGFYFDELSNRLSDSQIQLRGISDLSRNGSPNVNILTTLQEQRLKALVSHGNTFAAASTQSQTEVLLLLGISAASVNGLSTLDSMRIDGATDQDAVLLAASVVLSQMASDLAKVNGTTEAAELSNLINTIAAGIASTGTLASATFIPARNLANTEVNAATVTANVEGYYAANGATVTAPPFVEWVDQSNAGVLPQRLLPVANLTFADVTTASPGQSISSNAVTVTGLGTGVAVKVAASAGATIIKNGVPVVGQVSIAENGDTLSLEVTALGFDQTTTSTLQVGSSTARWNVTSISLSGTITGLTGSGLVLMDNLGDTITVSSGGASFSFPPVISTGQPYSVSVMTAPSAPLQTCSVINGTGTVGAVAGAISVVCSVASELALVANENSNVVSVYAIDPTSGTLNAVPGSPFAISANSIVIDATGQYALVEDHSASISVYSINGSTGSLTQISGSPFADDNVANGISVDTARNFAYATNSDGTISAYSIDTASGALAAVSGSPFATGQPFSARVSIDQDAGYLFYSYDFPGSLHEEQSLGVLGYAIDSAGGGLSSISGSLVFSPGDSGNPIPIVFTPNGKFAYQSQGSSNQVLAFTMDAGTGVATAVAGSPFAGIGADSVAVDPSGRFLYVSDDSDFALLAFSINASTGALTPISGSPYATGGRPNCPSCNFASTFVSIDSTGNFIYVQSELSATTTIISAFQINPIDGSLTAVPGSPFVSATDPFTLSAIAFARIH